MPLPFTSIPDVLAPDDVVSFQHEQRLVDRVNDSASLVEVQHERRFTALRGSHTSAQFPVAMAIYQLVGTLNDQDPWDEALSWNITSRSWRKWSANLIAGTVWDFFDMVVHWNPALISPVRADVFVEFSGAPGNTPRSNLTAITPYVEAPSQNDQDPNAEPQLRIHFGSRDVDKIVQFTVLLHGAYVTR